MPTNTATAIGAKWTKMSAGDYPLLVTCDMKTQRHVPESNALDERPLGKDTFASR
jgi:hypothetical protein